MIADDEWAAIALMIEEAWPGDFEPPARKVYRALLAPFDATAVMTAITTMVHRGQRFRPSASELVGALTADPGKPTFEEAFEMIFGRGGVLKARSRRSRFDGERDRAQANREAALERAADLHQYIRAFVATYGVDRLRMLNLDDPVWGEKTRRELRDAWDRFVVAADDRIASGRALEAMGRGREIGPRRLDPLAVLGLGGAGTLGAGES